MWQPIETAPHGHKLIVYGVAPGYMHPHTMIARYWPTHTLEVADGYEAEDWAEVGDSGTAYMPAGWYEENNVGDDAPFVNVNPTHWSPLPEPPDDN